MSSYQRRFMTFWMAIALMAPDAFAQPTSDATRLPRLLEPGDSVLVLDRMGAETQGRVEAVGETTVDLRAMTLVAPGVHVAPVTTRIQFDQINAVTSINPANLTTRQELYQRADTFGSLKRRLKSGEMVRIVDAAGIKTDGRVRDLSHATLAIDVRTSNPRDGSNWPRYAWTGTQTFAPSAVARIERPAHLWDGALKGAAVAFGIVGIMLASQCNGCTNVGSFLVMTTGIGAAIGVGIDAAFPSRKIYRAPK